MLVERALLAALRADCHSPVAAFASLEGRTVTLRAELLAEDGSLFVAGDAEGDAEDGDLAERVARDLLDRAPPRYLALPNANTAPPSAASQ